MKKSIWSSKNPQQTGWFWVKYKAKRGEVICPASLCQIGELELNKWFCSTFKNDRFIVTGNKPVAGFKFGPELTQPE
jgi:hypothetical protein